MIYLKSLIATYSIDAHRNQTQDESGIIYNYPFTDLSDSIRMGLNPQRISFTPYITNLITIPWQDIIFIGFDNTTWQKVLSMDFSFNTIPGGGVYPFTVNMIVSPLRLGTAHASGDKWGLASTTLAQSGNHTAYAKLVYYAPRFYLPLAQNLIGFAGASITFTRVAAKTYEGISYPANTPIFDAGLYVGTDDVASLVIPNYVSGTLLIKIKFKEGSDTAERDILKTPDFKLWLDETNQKIKLTKGANTLQCAYVNADYEAGTVYLIGLKWNATNTYLAVAKWDAINLTFEAASLVTTSAAWTIVFGTAYFGSSGTNLWMKDILSDFILYDYEVADWTTAQYILTLNALRWNDFYIANKTAGIITYENGKLTDEDDNNISGLTSGSLLTEGIIEMVEGLSSKWIASISDCYFP